jgi:hypothetical protein
VAVAVAVAAAAAAAAAALGLAPVVVAAALEAGCPHKLPLRAPLMHKKRGLSGIAIRVS